VSLNTLSASRAGMLMHMVFLTPIVLDRKMENGNADTIITSHIETKAAASLTGPIGQSSFLNMTSLCLTHAGRIFFILSISFFSRFGIFR